MDAEAQDLCEAQGLRLLRAFLRLPPDKRAGVIACVEQMAIAAKPPPERVDQPSRNAP